MIKSRGNFFPRGRERQVEHGGKLAYNHGPPRVVAHSSNNPLLPWTWILSNIRGCTLYSFEIGLNFGTAKLYGSMHVEL